MVIGDAIRVIICCYGSGYDAVAITVVCHRYMMTMMMVKMVMIVRRFVMMTGRVWR